MIKSKTRTPVKDEIRHNDFHLIIMEIWSLGGVAGFVYLLVGWSHRSHDEINRLSHLYSIRHQSLVANN